MAPFPAKVCKNARRNGLETGGQTNDIQETMFVDIVQAVKAPQYLVPTLVRFDCFYRLYHIPRHAAHFLGCLRFVYS